MVLVHLHAGDSGVSRLVSIDTGTATAGSSGEVQTRIGTAFGGVEGDISLAVGSGELGPDGSANTQVQPGLLRVLSYNNATGVEFEHTSVAF